MSPCLRKLNPLPRDLISAIPAVFLAKRFAAKEAPGKALGTGVCAPFVLPAIGIQYDFLGKPFFKLPGKARTMLQSRGLIAHRSLSDEKEFAIAIC